MKYLITGITGFAGPHLANLLIENGHTVYGLVRRSNGMESDIMDVVPGVNFAKIEFLYADLQNRDTVDGIFMKNKFDGVFHLAAQSHPPTSFTHPVDTLSNNIMGTAYLIDAISRWNPRCRFMFCSTSEVYGNSGRNGRALRESDPLVPCNPYAVSKAAMDLYVQERMVNGAIEGFITRSFSHTGPRRGKNFSISSDAYQIARIMFKYQRPILAVGNLTTVRVVVDVRDVVRAYYLLMINKKSSGGVFNICGRTPRKMGYFTDELCRLSGTSVTKKISSKYYRKKDIYYQRGDVSRLRALTGWEPRISIGETLSDLLKYWLNKL